MKDKELNFILFSQPGDGVVFMAQTLEKIYREKLTLMPKPECEVKGRKMSEGISQHPWIECQVLLTCPQSPFNCIERLCLQKGAKLKKTVSAVAF